MAISKKVIKTLQDLYLGDTVILYLKGLNVLVGNEEMGTIDVTPMLTGIVMDTDETFIHLGDGNMITKSIYHENIGLIESTTISEMMITPDMAISDSEIN